MLYGYDDIFVLLLSTRGTGTDQPNSNKVLINSDTTLIGNLSPSRSSYRTNLHTDENSQRKMRVSSKLELVSSTSDILNDFIINTLSDINISDLFADPENKYEDSYEKLDKFRKEMINKQIEA